MPSPITPESENPRSPSITELLRELLTSDAAWSAVAAFYDLSQRQSHAARGVLGGRTYKQIGAPLGRSAETIHSHVEKVYDRVGLHGDDRHRAAFTARILDCYISLRAAERPPES